VAAAGHPAAACRGRQHPAGPAAAAEEETPIQSTELCYLSAAEALAAFAARRLSPVEVLQAQIARIEAVNPRLNALTHTHFEPALAQARAAEARYASGTARPLEGLSCGIKDLHPIAGQIATAGSRAREHHVPDQTAPTVERLIEAGAIVHIRTTTPEFGHCAVTRSPLWGITRNPWNQEYSPGGSSGGSAAAVAAGMTTIADGTDGGGSIRIPAALTGTIGYKPPFGRNPLDREHPGETLIAYGPIVRSVADAALMQNVMSGAHNADLYSLREKIVLPRQFEGIKGWKVALSMDLGYFEVDRQVQRNTQEAAAVFRALGCTVEPIGLGWDQSAAEAFNVNWESVFHAALAADFMPQWRDRLDPFVVKIHDRGREHSAARFIGVQKVRYALYQKLAPVFDRYDLLICPTVGVPGIKADHDLLDRNFTINGKRASAAGGWMMTYPFNLLNQLPIMAMPSGFSAEGLPTGIQIVGRSFDDQAVFRGAAAFEQATQPWAGRRPEL
jgi:amidase